MWYSISRARAAICAAVLSAALAAAVDASNWNPWGEHAGQSNRCERPWRPTSVLREPANALSNAALVAVAVYCVWPRRADQRSALPPEVVLVYAMAVWRTAVGSFWHHACQCMSGTMADLRALVGLFGTVLATTLFAWRRSYTVFVLVVAGSEVGAAALPLGPNRVLFATGAGMLIAIAGAMTAAAARSAEMRLLNWPEGAARGRQRARNLIGRHRQCHGVAAFLAMLVALGLWLPEEVFGECVLHDATVSLHALWHVAASVALQQHFRFCEGQERRRPPPGRGRV